MENLLKIKNEIESIYWRTTDKQVEKNLNKILNILEKTIDKQ